VARRQRSTVSDSADTVERAVFGASGKLESFDLIEATSALGRLRRVIMTRHVARTRRGRELRNIGVRLLSCYQLWTGFWWKQLISMQWANF
jgi:hypothetical protein